MRRLLVLLLAFSLLTVAPRVLGGDSSGSAAVGNVAPEVVSATRDRARTDDYFTLSFTLRDNNTLNGLVVRVVAWHTSAGFASPNNATNHLSFVWAGGAWSEETLAGHLSSSTAPVNLNLGSGAFSLTILLDSTAIVGSWTVRIVADDSVAQTTRDVSEVMEKIQVTAITPNVAGEKLEARLTYESDGSSVYRGTMRFNNQTSPLTDSSGWGVFDLSNSTDFAWNLTCYGFGDYYYDIHTCSLNQSVPLAKATQLIGGDCPIASAIYDGDLHLAFATSGGSYHTEVSAPKPLYLLNVEDYDLNTDYTTRLRFAHDGSRNVTVGYGDWGGTRVRSALNGYYTNVTLIDEVLTLSTVRTATHCYAYVEVVGRSAPTTVTGVAGATFDPATQLWCGDVVNDTDIVLIFASGGTPGGTGELNIRLLCPEITMKPGGVNNTRVAVTWLGPSIYALDFNFTDYEEWVSVVGELPVWLNQRVLPSGESGAYIYLRVKAPMDASGLYSVPVEGIFATNGATGIRASGSLWVRVEPTEVEVLPPPTQDLTLIAGASILLLTLLMVIRRRENRAGKGKIAPKQPTAKKSK